MIKESLFAAEEREAKLDDVLQVMEIHVDVKALAAEINAPRPSRERGGRPPFPTELMVRTLILQHLLSDEQMEYHMLDRLSFQRFLGLRRSRQVHDRTTLGWRVHIQRKAEKGQSLSACQERRNTRIARTRVRVEHVFAAMVQMGGKPLRGIGLDRAAFLLTGKAAAYKLRRQCSLKAYEVTAF
jgi:hypothetical protein